MEESHPNREGSHHLNGTFKTPGTERVVDWGPRDRHKVGLRHWIDFRCCWVLAEAALRSLTRCRAIPQSRIARPGVLKSPEASDFGGNRTPCSLAITHPFLLGLIVSVFTSDQGTPLIFCDLHSKWHHSSPLKFKKAGLMNHKLQANWLRNPSHLTAALPRPRTPKDGRNFPGCFWKGAQRPKRGNPRGLHPFQRCVSAVGPKLNGPFLHLAFYWYRLNLGKGCIKLQSLPK